ncbi:hypothetical protein PMAC_002639 [Pneumocystis sp. 'macacae']|nr:hypothetical protein PMAC_002639 [Pneumocystis sp. 'macacae']
MPSKPRSRPTTPLRRIEKGGLSHLSASWSRQDPFPLDALAPAFTEMADALTDVQHNFEHIQSIHANLVQFNESFASFLYGLNMNAFCVDFPEAPVHQSFKRAENNTHCTDTSYSGIFSAPGAAPPNVSSHLDVSADTTFTTNDTSFVEHPSHNTRQTRTLPQKTSKSARSSRQSFKPAAPQTVSSTTRPRYR